MSNPAKISLLSAMVVSMTTSMQAVNYNDATGDLNDGTVGTDFSGFTHLDIASVEISNDATDIMFKINLVGDPVATDWGKYMIGFDSVPGGDTAGNGWSRPISMSSGMDYWIGSWADNGNGANMYAWDGAVWNSTAGPSVTGKDTSSITVQTSLASLGLSIGDSFDFDVYSSGGGGGDSAIDALANPSVSVTDWGGPYDSGANVYQYTVVPEPASVALSALGLAALWGMRRRSR